ncbi:MAG: transcriptional repressor LexA [Deltaproteobacteria bacterium]|nr:transcriptional repressor LexA [Deltaproteobacteria bacterium]
MPRRPKAEKTTLDHATPRARLTDRQRQVLDFIHYCIEDRGLPPTLREIGEHMGIRSTNGVNDHLKALERKGYLQRDDLKSRALRTSASPQLVSVPLVGDVAAGMPVLAVEHIQETLRMDRSLLGPGSPRSGGDLFALRVRGESMIEDGIFDGDYVFVRRGTSAHKGETVVALIDDEATVKRYYPEDGRVRLQPANATMEPIYVSADEGRDLQLLGTVVGVYRRL